MSQQCQRTDATEVDSQPNAWDFPKEVPGKSIDSLRSGYLQPISELSNGDSFSALSSIPSEILAPTFEALSNMESMRHPNSAERLWYKRKK